MIHDVCEHIITVLSTLPPPQTDPTNDHVFTSINFPEQALVPKNLTRTLRPTLTKGGKERTQSPRSYHLLRNG